MGEFKDGVRVNGIVLKFESLFSWECVWAEWSDNFFSTFTSFFVLLVVFGVKGTAAAFNFEAALLEIAFGVDKAGAIRTSQEIPFLTPLR